MEFFAVIPTHNRPKECRNLVKQLRYQGVPPKNILVIENSDIAYDLYTNDVVVYRDPDPSPHIYEMWNTGIDRSLNASRGGDWCVAVLNDDIILPNHFVESTTTILKRHNPTIVFPNQFRHTSDILNREPGPTSLDMRVTGYCFVMNGTHGLRCDERFKWWYGDDDLCWRARADHEGTYLIQDLTVQHLYPSQSTNSSPERTAQAGRDRELFIAKHGRAPW